MMPIITLQRRLKEVGRIRLGQQVATSSGKRRPEKLDRFRLTSRDQRVIEAAAGTYGGTVGEWEAPDGRQWEVVTDVVDLPVVVPPGDMSFSQWYELWSVGGCQRRCDGVVEHIGERACVCDPDARECSMTTRLSVLLPEVPGFGLWRVESHGYYAASELAGVVELCQRASQAGHMLPARLRLEQRMVKRGGKTHRFAVPVLDLDVSVSALGALGAAGSVPVAELGAEAPTLPSFTPVGELPEAPSVSVAAQVAEVAEPKERKPRRNAAAPLPATGLTPRTAAEAAGAAPVVDVAAQKRLVLDVCGGDRDLAKQAWDLHGADVAAIEAWLHEPREDSRPDDGSVAGRLQQPAGDPERTGGGDNDGSAPGAAGTPSPAASKLSAAQKAMHAKVGELVEAGVWPKADADMLRKGVISAITAGQTDSSHQLDRDAMSDVLDALDAVASGDLEVRRRATGEWSIDPARRRREAS